MEKRIIMKARELASILLLHGDKEVKFVGYTDDGYSNPVITVFDVNVDSSTDTIIQLGGDAQ
jgi:hypothetical protein